MRSIAAQRSGVEFDVLRGISIIIGVGLGFVAAAFVDSTENAAFASATLLAIAILVPIVIEMLTVSIDRLCAPVNIIGMSIIYWILLDVIQFLYELPVEKTVVVQVVVMSAVFQLSVIIGSVGNFRPIARALTKIADITVTAGQLFGLMVVSWTAQMSFYLGKSDWNPGTLLSALTQGRGRLPWARGDLGDSVAAFEFLTYFGFLLPAMMAVFSRLSSGAKDWRFFCAACMALSSVYCIGADGSRRSVGSALLAGICLFFLSDRRASLKLSVNSIRKLVGYGFLVSTLLVGLNLLLETRGAWEGSDFTGDRLFSGIYVDDNFLRMAQVLEAVPRYADYAGMQPIIFSIVTPIPRVLWEGKPISPGFTIHEYLGYTAASLSMGLIAELYTCLGWFTVIAGGMIVGAIARVVDEMGFRVSSPGLCCLKAICLGWLFVSMRSMKDAVILSYPIVALLILLAGINIVTTVQNSTYSLLGSDFGEPDGVER